MKDDFGDRMKNYERIETDRCFDPSLPLYARIDGRSFSRFTKQMKKPYDIRMVNSMIEMTKFVVAESGAKIGYTQSDESSFVWNRDSDKAELFFAGKIQKLTSILASMATISFAKALLKNDLEDYLNRLPVFDCRIFQLPSKTEAANAILWREQDSRKNAISMAASCYFSHKELQGKTGKEKIQMLAEKGIKFEDYPNFFKQGTFVRKESFETFLTEEQILKIPENKRPPNPVTRSRICEFDMPPFSFVGNRVEVIFDGAKPE